MGKIRLLDESVSNIISAGEVVENPASMVKELLENSLDAQSDTIILDIKDGGRYVKIADNGSGMSREDLLLSIERHATSKISQKDDLFSLTTYGFRGEALSSISAVSKFSITSRTEDEAVGHMMSALGGKVTNIKEIERNRGTTIEIKELFYNTPARLKFLRKKNTEYLHIKEIIIQEALANYDVGITLIIDGKVSIKTTGNGLDNTIVEIFGGNTLKNLKKFELGYLGNSNLYKHNRDFIFTFVNGRMVKSKLIEDAVIEGYYTKLMKGKYPFAIVYMNVEPSEVDVNVHPSKKVVKFANEEEIFNEVLSKIENSFAGDEDFVSPTMKEAQEIKGSFLDFSEFEKFEPLKMEKQSFVMDIPQNTTSYSQDSFEVKEKSQLEEYYDRSFGNNKVEFEKIEENRKEEKSPKITPDSEIEIKKKDVLEEKTVKKERVNQTFRVIGQVFDTFILVERNGIFEVYDQHIVHERILYEQLKAQYSNKNNSIQQLLVPIRITVDPREYQMIFDNEEEFERFGFELDKFSDNEILIRGVPTMELRDSVENIFRNILNGLKDKKNIDIKENILISMSCRGAVKAGEKLTIEEMKLLIEKLHSIGEYTCPHGRPIILKITLDDLEKLFKRK